MDEKTLFSHANSLNSCYVACKKTVSEFGNLQGELAIIVLNEIVALQKAGVPLSELKGAFQKGNLLEGLIILNAFLENENVKKSLINILQQIKNMYATQYKKVNNKILDCYFSNCNEEAIKISYQLVCMSKNILGLMGDKNVKKLVEDISVLMKENLEHAHARLLNEVKKLEQKKTTPKNVKKTTTLKSVKKTTK